MGPRLVVEAQILGNLPSPHLNAARHPLKTLLLECPIEAREVRVVVRDPHPAVPVREPPARALRREPLRELGPVIGLHGAKWEGRGNPRPLHEPQTLVRVRPETRERVRPPGTDVEERVDAQAVGRCPIEDGVDFDELTWCFGARPGRVGMPLLPA